MNKTLSVILLAFNESASIKTAVAEIHAFCQQHAPIYEIIIVDDGSTDETAQYAQELLQKNVKLVSHEYNQGMGASLKDGYGAAEGDYLVALPADRQVRAGALAAFIPYLDKNTVVLGRYPVPHSGRRRAIMSLAFRTLLTHVAKLSVDVSGAYIFSRSLYLKSKIPDHIAASTFLYSFQLLESFKQHGASFSVVEVMPFRRETGRSRVVTPRRIFKLATEIVRHRLFNI